MKRDGINREQELFHLVRSRPAAERAAFLAEMCASDEGLRRRLTALLEAAENAGDFLAEPDEGLAEGSGTVIGRYRLVEKLGVGGFGVVYRAEQETPVRRSVALKIIKVGMDTRAVIARFEAERQALALMEHPHIARVLDGGATAAGRPYFVMELVPGVPLNAFGGQHRLTLPERLEVFLQICRAVQHAHQKGVIHRDLKPSNILVALQDGKPVAKVIDFGVAKAIREPLTDQTLHTRLQLFIGTPPYMSPEQFGAGGQDVDTRADIYGLGALLYEWLTEATPFDRQRLSQVGWDEVGRILREVEPIAPSRQLATLGDAQQTLIAAARGTSPGRLRAALRGDLDRIVLKCLEKDRERRYETAEALARDIERYLRNEPVSARPASFGYLGRKFVRRHRRGVLAVGIGVFVLVALSAYHTRRLALERDRAQLEAEKARKVSALLTEALSASDPFRSSDRVGVASDLLTETAARARKEFAHEPALRAEILNAVGRVYLRRGRHDEAQAVLLEALTASREMGGPTANLGQSLNDLGVLRREQGDYANAVGAFRQALTVRRQLPESAPNDLAVTLVELGPVYNALEQLAPAESCFREALEIRQTHLGEHRETAVSLGDLGVVLWLKGDFAGAEPLLEAAVAMYRRTVGTEHPNFAGALGNLALLRRDQGNLSAAEQLLQNALAVYDQTLGPQHWRRARFAGFLSSVLRQQNRLAEAAVLIAQAAQVAPLTPNGRDPVAVAIALEQAQVDLAQGNKSTTEGILRRVLDAQLKLYPESGWQVATTRSLLAETLLGRGRPDEAEALLVAAHRVLREIPGVQGAETANTRRRLIQLYTQTGRLEQAEALRSVPASRNTPRPAR